MIHCSLALNRETTVSAEVQERINAEHLQQGESLVDDSPITPEQRAQYDRAIEMSLRDELHLNEVLH